MLKAKSQKHKWRLHTLEKNEYETKKNKKQVSKEKLDNDGEIAQLVSHLSQQEP
jgi:hypothetical protein